MQTGNAEAASNSGTSLPSDVGSPSTDSNSGQNNTGTGGVTRTDQIALGCGIGIGIPSLLVATLTLIYTANKCKGSGARSFDD
jgi:hypothetical protein